MMGDFGLGTAITVRGAEDDTDEVVTRIALALGEVARFRGIVIESAISTSFFDKVICSSLRLNL
jgi:hypothetical protein